MVKISGQAKFYVSIIMALLIAIGSWAIFSLARLGVSNLLVKQFNITSEVTQLIVLIVAIIIVLIIFGYSFKKVIQKLVK